LIYVVPVSGGKDSQACVKYALERHAHERHRLRFVHQNTGYDHPDTYAHLKVMEQHYGIAIEDCKDERYFQSDDPFQNGVFAVVKSAGYFPNTVARNCTSTLKQIPFGRWMIAQAHAMSKLTVTGKSVAIDPWAIWVYMGMRSDESRDRNVKYGDRDEDEPIPLNKLSSKYDETFANVFVQLPLVDKTKEEVFAMLGTDPINPLYSKGAKRVGCFPCLLAGREDWDMARKDPEGLRHIDRLLELEDAFAKDGSFRVRLGKDGQPVKRKLIKIHTSRDVSHWRQTGEWKVLPEVAEQRKKESEERKLKKLAAEAVLSTPDGNIVTEEPIPECGWCQTGSEN
jgi:3'-phosphoadenosine 5'-phosphosulfate sulfotransferase (PAPS reductase)/FAD synthetase